MKIKGVVATGQFNEDGNLIRVTGELPSELMERSAQLCLNQRTLAETFLHSSAGKTEKNWMPYIGSAIWGGKYTFVTMGCTFLIIEAIYADVNELMVDLLECGPTGPRQMNQ
jgi:roadblock/LC7 domain-containing protein